MNNNQLQNELELMQKNIDTHLNRLMEKQKQDFVTQTLELIVSTAPLSILITFIVFLTNTYAFSITWSFIIYFYIFSIIFLILFCIGTIFSFWQEEFAIVKLSMNLGKLHSLNKINKLTNKLNESDSIAIVDENEFLEKILLDIDNYFLFDKPLPKFNKTEINFLTAYNLISFDDISNQYIVNAKSKKDFLNKLNQAL